MAKVVQPRARLAGAATKPDVACKLDEHAGHDIGIDRSAGREDEQVLTRRAAPSSDREVPVEGIDGAAMKRNEPRLVELRLPHDQSVSGDVGQAQCAYFATPQSGGGDQSDDAVPGMGRDRPLRRKRQRGRHQRADLGVGQQVRGGPAPSGRPKHILGGDLVAGVLGLEPHGEPPGDAQPLCLRRPTTMRRRPSRASCRPR